MDSAVLTLGRTRTAMVSLVHVEKNRVDGRQK